MADQKSKPGLTGRILAPGSPALSENQPVNDYEQDQPAHKGEKNSGSNVLYTVHGS
ncbi:MAG: hypothetical protein ACK5DD_03520 [Cyclobacteriaceae bacterium]|jgi:hypothetical protein